MPKFLLFIVLLLPGLAYADIMGTLHKAEKGDMEAQLILGYMYDNGEVVSENAEQAVKWFRKAAEQGSIKAQLILAYKYDLGDGVEQNHAKALKWYKEAAMQGNVQAQDNLAGMYAFGEGVPMDYVTAYAWYNIAASSGFEMAKEDRDFLEAKMTASQIEKGQELSKSIYKKINKAIVARLSEGEG